jgi:hypothetical protein
MTFVTNTPAPANPVSDYSSRDYDSVYQDLLNRIPVYLPGWTSQSPNDFGIVLLQMYAYVTDLVSYYVDRLAGEAFIETATQAVSIISLASMLDYQATLSAGSTVELQLTLDVNILGPYTVPAGTGFSTVGTSTQAAIAFETIEDLTIAGNNAATPSVVGTVLAVQGTTQSNEAVAISDGTVNQIYPLLFNPVSAGSFTVSVDLGLGPQAWSSQQSLLNSGPTAQVYTTFVDANGVFYIIFGDGVNGYVPPLGSPIYCTYMINDGATGNVGIGTITQPLSSLVGIVAVTNPQAASGGTDSESLSSIQQNAPASLKTLNRAVTSQDIETLAIQVSGVEWASSAQVTYQLVNLYIAPFGGGPPTTALQDAVAQYVDALVMANTTVTILPPTYIPIDISVTVVAYSNYGNTTTENVVSSALATLLSLPNTGFGARISLGLVYQAILEQPGVNYAIVNGISRETLVTLTGSLTNGTPASSLSVTPLPQPVFDGDTLVLTNLTGGTQTVVVGSPGAVAGAITIPIGTFTPSSNYPIGSNVQDTTGTPDAVLLANEIPIAGLLTISVSGGVIGS